MDARALRVVFPFAHFRPRSGKTRSFGNSRSASASSDSRSCQMLKFVREFAFLGDAPVYDAFPSRWNRGLNSGYMISHPELIRPRLLPLGREVFGKRG